MRPLITFLATGAYTGYVPIAPGTAGSVLGLILAELIFVPIWSRSPTAFLMLFAVLFVGGCFVAGSAEHNSGRHDDSHIVIDEIFGMVAALFLIPSGWLWLIAAFALFRLLDVVKPWPASYFDAMDGGAGVMLDDLAAGIYANLALQIIARIV
jgi:phosphatidylglycerophosphatase A